MVAGHLPKHIDQSRAYGHPLLAFDETIKEERRSQEILQPKLWTIPSFGLSILPKTEIRTYLLVR